MFSLIVTMVVVEEERGMLLSKYYAERERDRKRKARTMKCAAVRSAE